MEFQSMTALEADFQTHYEFCPYCDKKHNRVCAIGYCKLRAAIQKRLTRKPEDAEEGKRKTPRVYRRRKILRAGNAAFY